MKRTFWAGVGYTAGLGTSLYVQKRVRRTVERYAPQQVRHDVAAKGRGAVDRAKEIVIDLRDAAREGAEAMRVEHQELTDEFGTQPSRHQPRPARGLRESSRGTGPSRPRQ